MLSCVAKPGIGVPGRPAVTDAIMRSRVSSRRDSSVRKFRGGVASDAWPQTAPRPSSPWQTEQDSV